jgi:hypothetical protein
MPLKRLADGCGSGVCHHRRAVEALTKLNRDRGCRALSGVVESLGLGLDHSAELVDVEVRLVPGCHQNAANGARHGAHSRSTARELSPGIAQLLEEILAT